MPLHSTFSPPLQLVVTIAKGEVKPGEMQDYLAQVDANGARAYRKMFDITALETPVTAEMVRRLAALVRARESEGASGPIAIVVATDKAYRKARLFAVDATVKRPIKVFREQHQARKWLDGFGTARSGG